MKKKSMSYRLGERHQHNNYILIIKNITIC